MKECKKATKLCIKNNTSVTKSNKQNWWIYSNMEVNVKDIKCSPNSKCGKTAIFTYLNEYIKSVTLGLVFIYSTSIICSICPRKTLHMRRVIWALYAYLCFYCWYLKYSSGYTEHFSFFNVFNRIYIWFCSLFKGVCIWYSTLRIDISYLFFDSSKSLLFPHPLNYVL